MGIFDCRRHVNFIFREGNRGNLFINEVASTLNKIGKLSYELGDMTSVMSYYKEGLKVERAALEPDHPHIMVTHIAQIHKQRGNYVAAVRKYHEVHMMQVRIFGPNHIDIAARYGHEQLFQGVKSIRWRM
jgi:hypothetical protein